MKGILVQDGGTSFRVIGVIGAGAMGAGLAQVAAAAGFSVLLDDQCTEAAARGVGEAAKRLRRLVEKGQLDAAAAEAAVDRIRMVDDLTGLADAELVIEAIVERLDIKQELFERLEAIVGENTILASNTSALPIAAIAKRCSQPARVCGMHFFNPVPLMKLVEVIRAPATSQATIDAAMAVARQLGKIPVEVKDSPGFLVNLGNRAFVTEALQLLHERVSDVDTIDRILKQSLGFRMGPFELMDLTGIDVNYPAARIMSAGYQNDTRLRTTPFHEALFNAGLFGRKTRRGFHDYASATEAPPSPLPPADGEKPFAGIIADSHPGFKTLFGEAGLSQTGDRDDAPILVAPIGEDATECAVRLKLDPARVVAIDFTGLERRHLTLMSPPGGRHANFVAEWLRSQGYECSVIKDSPGFVAQRIAACIANLGCEMAQIGLASPADIDTAMRLGLNYPRGPLELAEWQGVEITWRIMTRLQEITGDDRYRPSQWLRRRALLNLPIYMSD